MKPNWSENENEPLECAYCNAKFTVGEDLKHPHNCEQSRKRIQRKTN